MKRKLAWFIMKKIVLPLGFLAKWLDPENTTFKVTKKDAEGNEL